MRREVQIARRSQKAVDLRRWLTFAAVAAGFFFIALSNEVYNLTSPPTLSWHVLLRKALSIVAFAVVGGAFVWASGASLRRSALVIALYSGAIEIAQHFVDGPEPYVFNAVDVLCGALGGALGALIPWVRVK
jgi:hypothetical protein